MLKVFIFNNWEMLVLVSYMQPKKIDKWIYNRKTVIFFILQQLHPLKFILGETYITIIIIRYWEQTEQLFRPVKHLKPELFVEIVNGFSGFNG